MAETPPTREKIARLRKHHDDELLILGHFYQNEAILSQADIIGDSYKLSLEASRSTARHIVFCGVRFMAESARILCGPDQRVYIPDRTAGCPMADMIDPEQFEAAYQEISASAETPPVPLLYVNSSAEIKAMAGKRDGICCTSSNAARIARSLLEENRRIFFLPDRNLGWNLGEELGLEKPQMQIIRPGDHSVGTTKLILWDGWCPIHARFSPDDVESARLRFPGCRILVHPESPPEVVGRSDGTGSTSQLFKTFEAAPSGSVLVIGTEIEFVTRLAALRSDVTVIPLSVSRCRNMAKITEDKLLQTLMSLEENHPGNEVLVKSSVARNARLALERMIQRVEGKG